MFLAIFKANPYHDEHGRFTTHGGANFMSSWGKEYAIAANARQKGRASLDIDSVQAELNDLRDYGAVNVTISAKDWVKYGDGITPKEFFKACTGGDNGTGTSILELSDKNTVTYYQHGGSAFGAKVQAVHRTYDGVKKVVTHDYLKLESSEQGAGAIKKMFREALPIYLKAGVRRIDLHANLEMGGYAWGKYGFRAKKPAEFKHYCEEGITKLENSAKWRKLEIPQEAKAELESIKKVLSAHASDKYITHIVTDIKTPHLDKALKSLFPKDGMTFIKSMLGSSHWMGELSLNDIRSLKRLKKYISLS